MKKLCLIMLLTFGLVCFSACKEEVSDKQEKESSEEDNSDGGSEITPEEETSPEQDTSLPEGEEEINTEDVEFVMQDVMYEDGNIVASYPYFQSDTYYDGIINPIIQSDFENYIDGLQEQYSQSLDGEFFFTYNYYNHQIMSITYVAELYDSEIDIYINDIHMVNVSLTTRDIVPFSDIFVVDEELVNDIKTMFMYNPGYAVVNLEEEGIDIPSTLDYFYMTEDMLGLMNSDDFSYSIDDMGLTVSFPMSNDYGEHIELSQKLELMEYKMIREHSVWTDYMFISND